MTISAIARVLALNLLATSALAHHSTNGIYHEEELMEVKGTVKEWRFINPHPYLTIEVEGVDGSKHDWDVSFGGSAVTHLKRRGYTADTFQPGETIYVVGHPARAEGAFGLLVERRDPVREDGTPVVP